MAPATSALPFILLLSLLAAASPSQPSSDFSSSLSSPIASNQGLPDSNSISNEKRSTRESVSSSNGRSEDEETAMVEKSAERNADGVHKIKVREAGPVRFWSGSRYGRSGRSSGGIQFRGSEAHSSLRSSNPVIQPRHDRFFLGSRYGKRSQVGQREEWIGRKVAGEEEEEEDESAEESAPEVNVAEEGEQRPEEIVRMLEEAMHYKTLENSENLAEVKRMREPSLEIQPVSCVYTGVGNLYRCYDGRRDTIGVH